MILNDKNFEQEISQAEKPVLVDFWMNNCLPCDLISPVLDELSGEFGEKLIFAKANFNDIPSVLQKFGINAAPTIVIFEKGKPIDGFIGLKEKDEFKEWLYEKLLLIEYHNYAEEKGFFLNPDKKITDNIIKGLVKKEKELGQRFCPCRRVTGEEEEDKKIICPCAYHLKEIEENGHCLCRLFVKNI